MDRAIYKQKIIDIVTEMKSRLTDPNNTATEDFAEGFTVALEEAGIVGLSFVEELPEEGVENILYIDKVLLKLAIWINSDWSIFTSGSGLTFSELVNILQEGTNISLDVDFENETITINSTGGITSVDWSDILNKPTEFNPSSHTQLDSSISLTETYTGNLTGTTTQKGVNDFVDSLNITSITTVEKTLTVANWSANQQSVTISGITANTTIWVAPKQTYANIDLYSFHQIIGVSQSTNTITFKCSTTPTVDVLINIAYDNK